MSWELVVCGIHGGLEIGSFGVKTINFNIKSPKNIRGKNANWYFDSDAKVAKIQVEKDGLKLIKMSVGIPKAIHDKLNEEMAVVYLAEDALYISSYKKGQEYLKAFLKANEVKVI